ncbi:MAG TPA: methylated-DNA--[protein]-cysteine S-methyltransferase [Candidatus Pelethosoma merdigallinarum]|nr:methylated-DNA--[protein]-cysteine S-methyltransferase [Candidatus Pelethosoma merdigallinarum]
MVNDMFYSTMESPIGTLYLIGTKDYLCQIKIHCPKEITRQDLPLFQEAQRQLKEYFSGKRKVFKLPIFFQGTPFQEKVWRSLLNIPYGSTKSYQEIAQEIGNEKAVRAVGGAVHRNPLPLILPCHRVIGKNGSLVGFGLGLSTKKWLLEHERLEK